MKSVALEPVILSRSEGSPRSCACHPEPQRRISSVGSRDSFSWERSEASPRDWRSFAIAQDDTVHVSAIYRTPPLSAWVRLLSLIHISEPTRLGMISYAVF